MKTREEILKTLQKTKQELKKKYKLTRLALFGSFAREEQTGVSDVDVLIDVDPSIGLEFVTVAQQLEKDLGLKVDLVSLRAMKPRYFKIISKELIDV